MNKLAILVVLAASLAVVYATGSKIGGFSEIEYNETYHKAAQDVAIEALKTKSYIQTNDLPIRVKLYQKIVSGVILKFVFQLGSQEYEVQIWSQPWNNKLDVISAKKIQN